MAKKQDWIARAKREGTPLIDGETVTFVWQGRRAPLLAGDFTDWERGAPVEMQRLGADTWIYQAQFPPDAYMEYAYLDGEQRLPDPFNPRTTPNGLGDTNHYFHMPAAAPTTLYRRRRGLPKGVVTHHRLEAKFFVYRDARRVYLYQPPVQEPVPLLVAFDGGDYLRRARLPVILDNLIAQGRIRPVALAMVDNGGPARILEYACNDITLGFLVRDVLPLAAQHLNLVDIRSSPGAYGVAGASMGGLMALYAGLRLPEIFGRVLSQSGAFSSPVHEFIVFQMARHLPVQPVRIWLDVGRYDYKVLTLANQQMATLLQDRGYQLNFRLYGGGHNWPSWRDLLPGALQYLYGNKAG